MYHFIQVVVAAQQVLSKFSANAMGGGEVIKRGWLVKSPPLEGGGIKVTCPALVWCSL